jgi:peptidoglycan/LPS O-acetylase OafA/YrhL
VAVSAEEGTGRGAAAPLAFKPPPGNPRFPLIDGLRAGAALTVLAAHTALISGYSLFGTLGAWTMNLNLAVAVFFVISAFLLYRPFLAAQLDGSKGPAIRRFYRRRFWRIVPAYWVALTVLSLYPGDHATFANWPKYYLFLQPYSPTVPSQGLFQAWSLAIEVAFYVFLPLYAVLVGRAFARLAASRRIRAELALLAGLALLSALCEYLVVTGHGNAFLLGVPRYFLWFSMGMAMAVVSVGGQHGSRGIPAALGSRPGIAWTGALVVFIVLGFITGRPPDGVSFTVPQEMTHWLAGGIVGLLIVLPAAVRIPAPGSIPSRVLATRAAKWLGLVSYGIFLWQMGPITWLWDSRDSSFVTTQAPILRFAIYTALTVALTIPLAALSYYVIERPSLRFKDPRRNRRPRGGPEAAGK